MTRTRGRLAALAAFGAAFAALVSACAHNDASLEVNGVLAPPVPQNGICAYTADPTQAKVSSGTLDVGLLSSYTPELLIGNQLISRENNTNLQAETARIVLQGAVVHVDDTNNNEINSFTSLSSGFIDPGTGGAPGYGPMSVTIIDPKTAQALQASLPALGTKRVIARVTVFGQTSGGANIESNEFQFPVDVCNGCLVTFPADSNDPVKQAANGGAPNCSATSTSSSTSTVVPCVVGQDQVVDCRLCQGKTVCDPSKVP
ncbi:MAG: hypothetical protein ABI183_17795 [Polyangiaceae bacterium]